MGGGVSRVGLKNLTLLSFSFFVGKQLGCFNYPGFTPSNNNITRQLIAKQIKE